jgi:hypothetical protein
MFAASAPEASELCFLRSLGYVSFCPGDISNHADGAQGFSTPDVDPCPQTPAPSTCLTISASATNPHLTVAPLPETQTSLYLWLVVPSEAAVGSIFADILGDIPLLGFESPYKHDLSPHPAGDRWSLYVDPLCEIIPGTSLLGEFRFAPPSPVQAESWGGIKTIYR